VAKKEPNACRECQTPLKEPGYCSEPCERKGARGFILSRLALPSARKGGGFSSAAIFSSRKADRFALRTLETVALEMRKAGELHFTGGKWWRSAR
jgi:hypothetical protein